MGVWYSTTAASMHFQGPQKPAAGLQKAAPCRVQHMASGRPSRARRRQPQWRQPTSSATTSPPTRARELTWHLPSCHTPERRHNRPEGPAYATRLAVPSPFSDTCHIIQAYLLSLSCRRSMAGPHPQTTRLLQEIAYYSGKHAFIPALECAASL